MVCLDVVEVEVVFVEMTVDNDVFGIRNIIKSCECNMVDDMTFIYYINDIIVKITCSPRNDNCCKSYILQL